MNNKPKTIVVIVILILLPILLYSQKEGSRIIGGEFRLEHLYFQRSPFGVRKDIDLGFALKYLKRLSPTFSIDSIPINKTQIKPLLLSSYWSGFSMGVSGYYSDTDSMIMNGTVVHIGPIIRYYATKSLFLETTSFLQYRKNRIGTPYPPTGKLVYLPESEIIGISCMLGVGYTVKLNSNIYFEPMLGYQITWNWLYSNQNNDLYFPYEKTHDFLLCMCFRYSF